MKQSFLFLFISFLCLTVKAEKKEKTIDKSFASAKLEQVFIENRYGNIEVNQWDRSDVKLHISVSVKTKKPDVSEEMLNQIDIEFIEKEAYLSISTRFDENFNFKRLTNKIFSGCEVKIDYTVTIPKGMTLKMVNRNGNVYLGDYKGILSVDVKNGNVKIGTLNKESELNVEDGRLDVEKMQESKCILKSCFTFIKECEFLNIDSRDSEIKIDKVNELSISSNSGEYRIGEVEVLRGSSSMTKFEVSDIGDELVFELWFGSMNVRNIHNMFSQVDLKTTRAKTGLTFMKNAAYDLEIRHTKNVKLDLPAGININKRNAAEKRTFISEAKVGGKNKFGSKVKIYATGCKLFVQ